MQASACRIKSVKHPDIATGNATRDFLACSSMLPPIAPPRVTGFFFLGVTLAMREDDNLPLHNFELNNARMPSWHTQGPICFAVWLK